MANTKKENETGVEAGAETGAEAGASVGEQLATKTGGSVTTDGVRARRGLAPKMLVPDMDWINKNVVAGGKGTRAVVGRIFGVATGAARKQNEFQGTMIDSCIVTGIFQAESFVTGELSEGSTCYFPMAYAEKIEALFKADASIKVIEVDCDIGLEATGKPIPYEWVVTAYREGEEMAVLKRIRGGRSKPTNLLSAPDGTPKQLTAPAK